jgi:putative spermidine/putrescine transport system substrate-binding protein
MITRRRLAAGWAVVALVAGACTGGGASPSGASPSTPAGSPPASEPAASGSATADICTAPPRHDGVTMTFTSFGGVYQEAQRKGWLEPYTELTGIQWQESEESSNATIRAQVEAGDVTWDVVDVGNDFGLAPHADLLEPLDYSLIKRDEILDGFAGDYRVADITYGVVLAYNTELTAGQVPEGWADFFDLTKFPGKRGLWKYSEGGVFEFALMADGVAPDELYPLDLERAIAKLDTIKSEIVWWESGAESQELIGSGEVAMSMIWNGRGWSAKNQDGNPVEMQWNQQILTADYFVVPKGTPNKQPAMEFIAWATCANNNAAPSEFIPYGPTNENATPNEAMVQDLAVTNTDENTAYFDDEYLAENYDQIEAAFQEWVTQ